MVFIGWIKIEIYINLIQSEKSPFFGTETMLALFQKLGKSPFQIRFKSKWKQLETSTIHNIIIFISVEEWFKKFNRNIIRTWRFKVRSLFNGLHYFIDAYIMIYIPFLILIILIQFLIVIIIVVFHWLIILLKSSRKL